MMDERNMFEFDWWKRSAAKEILQAIHTFSKETTMLYLSGESGLIRQRLRAP